MKRGKCPVCGQDLFDPFLEELKKGTHIEVLARDIVSEILNKVLGKGVSEDDIAEVEAKVTLMLMPEEG